MPEVFSAAVIAAIATKKAAMVAMHADVQDVLESVHTADPEATKMAAFTALREFDKFLGGAIIAATKVELFNEDEMPAKYRI